MNERKKAAISGGLLVIAMLILIVDFFILYDVVKTLFLNQQMLHDMVANYNLVDNISLLSFADDIVIVINSIGMIISFLVYQLSESRRRKYLCAAIAILMITTIIINQINSHRIIELFYSQINNTL